MTETTPKAPTFDDLALSPAVAQAVAEHGYREPTPVQLAAFGPACAGKDLVVQARTGTGKTAAFALPLVSSRVRAEPTAVQALVLCPTRELALQVTREFEALSQHTHLKVASVYGGASITKQLEELAQGAHIVVGTPGRVLDHLKRRTLDVSKLRSFVLDECDEMLSMGFLPQINDIWGSLPSGHQTLLFSATVPKEVTRIAETRLRDPQFITLSGDHIGALEIQHFVYLSHGNKLEELQQIIDVENPESAIVFCNTRDETKRVAGHLQGLGYAADWLNADLTQSEREQVMRRTREGALRFLVCTDVAARGIDISHLTHVINFDFPDASEQYVHRTGRTGRAGKIGTAISLIPPNAIGDLYYLRLKYKIQPQERHLPTRLERETRQHADVIASLSLRFGNTGPRDPYFQLARRLMASEVAENVIAGLLKATLGEADSAVGDATARRRSQQPSAVSPGPAASNGSPPRERATPRAKAPARDEQRGSRDSGSRDSGSRDSGSRDSGSREGQVRRRGRPRDDDGDEHSDEPFRYRVSEAPLVTAAQGAGAQGAGAQAADSASVAVGAAAADRAAVDRATVDRAPVDRAPVDRAPAGRSPREKPPRTRRNEMDRGDGTRLDSESVSDPSSPLAGAPSQYVELYVGVGRRDGARAEDLKQALGEAGIGQAETGRILIKQRHSYVEVTPAAHQAVIDKLNGSVICGREALVEVARARG